MNSESSEIRAACAGLSPLSATLPNWLEQSATPQRLSIWTEQFGSPLNIHNSEQFASNLRNLMEVANARGVAFKPFFARKANKCLFFVDVANSLGAGVDTASENEVAQVLDRRVKGDSVICTAAVKRFSLVSLCIKNGVTLVVDNADELELITETARLLATKARVAVRLSGFDHEGSTLHSRFGVPVKNIHSLMANLAVTAARFIDVIGLHFHLDGYNVAHRHSALCQSLEIYKSLLSNSLLHKSASEKFFIDIGGGLPTQYLADGTQWEAWQSAHREALLDKREPITRDNHSIGLTRVGEELVGKLHCYPPSQPKSAVQWLEQLLDSNYQGYPLSSHLNDLGIELRCEPGRSMLSGCGYTVARVVFRKQDTQGEWVIGVDMNRTQSRSGFTEHMTDPLLVPLAVSDESQPNRTADISGYLAGTYCTESEWLSLRKFNFPEGIGIGDYVIFPDTAGYLMHFVESRSHQFDLATNIFVSELNGDWSALADPIDSTG